MELLAGRYHAEINVPDYHGHSVLMVAAANDHIAIVDYLSEVLHQKRRHQAVIEEEKEETKEEPDANGESRM